MLSVKTEYTKYENIRFDKIIRKFVAKLLKYRILFKDILTFLILDYRDALLIILYLIGSVIKKSDQSDVFIT